jgi:hypothetical protein
MLKNAFALLLLFFHITLFANFQDGEKIFQNKCSSCHSKYISIKTLKENFFAKKNKLLNLEAPPVNMIVYDLIRGSKKLGIDDDLEMRQVEIEEFLLSYLEKPNRINSLTDETILPYLKEKTPMKIDEDEASKLAIYFMEYRKNRLEKEPKKKTILKKNCNEKDILNDAKLLNKKILVYTTSKTCHYCIKMEKEVLRLEDIKKLTNENFVFLELDVDHIKLPFNLDEKFKNFTPTFFFLDNKGKLLNMYLGSWKKDDYVKILKENI